MKKTFLTLILGIIIGILLASIAIPQLSSSHHTGRDKKMTHDDNHDHHNHHMKTIEVANPSSPPKVDLVIHKDPMKGWNIQLLLKNFKLSGAHASTEPIEGEGHLHLMINKEKSTRLYGEWYYISPKLLKQGKNEITVTLNANNHSDYTLNGKIIQDTEIINIP